MGRTTPSFPEFGQLEAPYDPTNAGVPPRDPLLLSGMAEYQEHIARSERDYAAGKVADARKAIANLRAKYGL